MGFMKEKVKTKIYERKNGLVKIYNGHVGTFVWENEECYEDEKESHNDEKDKELPDILY